MNRSAIESCGRRLQRSVAALACVLFAALAVAQTPNPAGDYPKQPIRLIVAFPAGAGADLTARTVAQKMGESMGQPVVVENRPGANGSVAAAAVAKSTPDGYTLLLADRGAFGINPHLYRQPLYDPLKDFAYVSIVTWGSYVLVTNADVPAKTFADLVKLAKASPGKLNYASFGVGSMPQLNLEALNRAAGMSVTHVPYKGGAPAATAVAAHEVDMTLATAPSVIGFVHDNRMRALVVGSTRRSPLLPHVPTVGEVGIGPDVLLPTYFGIAAPAGTPPAIVAKLQAEIRRALAQPDVADRLVKAGLDPHGGSPEEMAQTVRSDVARFGALVKEIGIQAE
jgi:tripartite-type tricarboxylate transporter receptor subunit TctC